MNRFETELYKKLKKQNLITEDALDKAVKESKELNVSLSSYLLDNHCVEEDALLSTMASIISVPYINLKEISVDAAAIKAVPVKFAWHYEFMPIKVIGKKLTLAVSQPLSIRIQDEIRLSLGYEIFMVLAKKEHILELIKTHYGLGSDTVEKMVSQGTKKPAAQHSSSDWDIEDIDKPAEDASVIKLVNQIIFEAYKKRATDIHIEPFRDKIRLRYRIDGMLYDQHVPEDLYQFLKQILLRIKIMANLDIVEHRIPQDGRAIVRTQDQDVDLRISFIPTSHGESVVIRILPTKKFFGLEKLGLAPKNQAIFESLIKKPHGIIFVTGPTGSGKTTSLYACLAKINTKEKKIITIEDPIEYELEGVTQIHVKPEVGLTFAQGLRSMLRHDPDIMMVGEVRDRETAEIAIRVALTGHLVLSTLHTNDSASGVTRLIEIGIEPYLVASSVQTFIAQRLVRVICPHCKTEDTNADIEVRRDIVNSLQLDFDKEVKVYRGKGCEHCNFTGFHGRTAIYELLMIDDKIKKLITEKASATEIKLQAIKSGMRTLPQDGWLKVIEGITTPEEVLNVCQDSRFELAEEAEEEAQAERSPLSIEQHSEKYASSYDKERRVYSRIPKRIPIRFRLVEKGPGDIIELTKEVGDKGEAEVFNEMLVDENLSQKVSEVDFKNVFSVSTNVSAGGLVFESRFLTPVDSILELKIDLPGEEKAVQCHAKVMRVEKDLPRCFYIAVCFLDISGADRRKIDQFVKKESSQQKVLDFNMF
ncbi:ATPase, T2SS/T4P/T4SS family [Candidatus Omnitrophota bacterium]